MSKDPLPTLLAVDLPPFAVGLLNDLRQRLETTAPPRYGNHPELPLERLRVADQTLLSRFTQVDLSLRLVYQIRASPRPALLYAGLVQEAINGWIEDRARAVGALHNEPRDGSAAPAPYIGSLAGVSVPLAELYVCTLDLRNSYAHNVVPDDFIGPDEPLLALCLLAYLLVAAVQIASNGESSLEFKTVAVAEAEPASMQADLDTLTKSAFILAARELLKDPNCDDPEVYLRGALRPWHLPRQISEISHLEGLRILTGRHVKRQSHDLSCSFNPPPSFTVHLQKSVPWIYPLLDYSEFLDRICENDQFNKSFAGAQALTTTFQAIFRHHVSWLLSKVETA